MKSLVFVGAALAILSATPALSQEVPDNDAPNDAVAVAALKGISVDEADRRLRLQQRIAEIEARMATDPNFAGLSIESTSTTFRVRTRFTSSPSANIGKYVTDSELASLFVGETAQVSLARLRQVQGRLLDLFATLRQQTAIRIDDANGQIVGMVRNPTAVQAVVDRLGFGQLIRLEQETRFPTVSVDLLGGQDAMVTQTNGQNAPCTTAFGVRSGNTSGILTAGHCAQTIPGGTFANTRMQVQGVTLNIQNSVLDATRDFAWAAGTGHVGTNRVFDGTSNRAITSFFRGVPSRGSTVCKYGRATRYTCQDVLNPSFTGTDADGTRYGPIVELGVSNGNIGQCRDSGGPFFNNSVAYGVVTRGDVNGRCLGGNRTYYIPIDLIGSFGLTLITN